MKVRCLGCGGTGMHFPVLDDAVLDCSVCGGDGFTTVATTVHVDEDGNEFLHFAPIDGCEYHRGYPEAGCPDCDALI